MSAISDPDSRPHGVARGRRWLWVGVLALVGLAVTLTIVRSTPAPAPAGDELIQSDAWNAYGWIGAKDVGAVFTDGMTQVRVSPEAKGPLRLVSATPLMDEGGAVRVLGVRARIGPDMLPLDYRTGWFQDSDGFPPTYRDAAGGVALEGLEVRVPTGADDEVWIELQIGYEGRSTRRGVQLEYEYLGRRHTILLPSYLEICAPATVTCESQL